MSYCKPHHLEITKALFTQVRTNFCMDKNLHCSTLHLQGTCRTGQIFELLSVQVWDVKKDGFKLAHLAIQKFIRQVPLVLCKCRVES